MVARLDDPSHRAIGMRAPVLREIFQQNAAFRQKQTLFEDLDEFSGAVDVASSGRRRLQRKIGFKEMHMRILPLATIFDRMPVEDTAMRRVLEISVDERNRLIGQPKKTPVAVQAIQPGDGEEDEGVRIGVPRRRDDAARCVDRKGETARTRGSFAKIAQERGHSPFGDLAAIGKPAKMRGMGEDVNLPRLHHGAARNGGDRAPASIQTLLETVPLRVKADRRPKRQRSRCEPFREDLGPGSGLDLIPGASSASLILRDHMFSIDHRRRRQAARA
jgi:hypothetical protein